MDCLSVRRANNEDGFELLHPLPRVPGNRLGLPVGSVGIGDRNYWPPELRDRLAAGGVVLLAPYDPKRKDPDPRRSAQLSAVRYRIETSNGQLAERYGIKRTWAKDLWHLGHWYHAAPVQQHAGPTLLDARHPALPGTRPTPPCPAN